MISPQNLLFYMPAEKKMENSQLSILVRDCNYLAGPSYPDVCREVPSLHLLPLVGSKKAPSIVKCFREL